MPLASVTEAGGSGVRWGGSGVQMKPRPTRIDAMVSAIAGILLPQTP